MLQNQFTHLRMILAKNPHSFFGLGRLGESSKASKIQKDHRDFLPVTSKRIISASSYDQLGKLRGKEAFSRLIRSSCVTCSSTRCSRVLFHSASWAAWA